MLWAFSYLMPGSTIGPMDWYLDGHQTEAASQLRHEIDRYLRRHGSLDGDYDGATLAVGELLANAALHTPGPVWVHLEWPEEQPLFEVHDLGPGFSLENVSLPDDPSSPTGRGLFVAHELVEDLEVAAKRAGGSRVTATLPVTRPAQRTHEPLRLSSALPGPEEANEDGTFGRESFLRALVVQLASAVEALEGPDAIDATVTAVGSTVGDRMEAEYRRARDIVGRLEPEQIADLYVRLKAAIEGDFYVIELSDERIVLGNRACPFGAAVHRAPGLCRMTSSVFGGIAARNTGEASVVLEERIAVGDPECRIVVTLGHHADGPAAHHYGPEHNRTGGGESA